MESHTPLFQIMTLNLIVRSSKSFVTTYRSRRCSPRSHNFKPTNRLRQWTRQSSTSWRQLKDLKWRWTNELPEVMWAYKTTARSTTRETPFSLAYKYEAMVLVEIRAGSLRRENYNLEQNETLQWRKLYFIEDKWHGSQLKVTAYQRCTVNISTQIWRRRDSK